MKKVSSIKTRISDTYYNRIMSETLLSKIESSYQWLIEIVKQNQELDFQTGSDPKSGRSWFSVYRGTGRILTIEVGIRKRFKITAHDKYKKLSSEIFIKNNLNEESFKAYLYAVNNIKEFDRYYRNKDKKNEGYFQNLISRRYTFYKQTSEDEIIIIDKELVIGFIDKDIKREWNNEIIQKQNRDIQNFREKVARKRIPEEIPAEYGEFDFLGLNKNGDLIIMELKENDSQKTYLSPVQVSFYKLQLRKYIEEHGISEMSSIILEMIQQKINLKLIQLPRGMELPALLSGNIRSCVIVGNENLLSKEVCRRFKIAREIFDPEIEAYTCTSDGTLIKSTKLN